MRHTTPSAKHRKSPTHRESLWRFAALAALLVLYFGFMSWKYDAATGAWLAALSWSFFVLCTPIADGGFIIDFPVRLLFGTRMLFTEIGVWVVAIGLNIVALSLAPQQYDQTALTRLLHTILTTPWPYWSIVVISATGTLLSIWFGDEMLDVTTHAARKKHHRHGFTHRTLVVVGLGLLTVLAYSHLLRHLGVEVPGGG